MSKNLYISVLQKRARVALTENGELIEFHVERGGREKIVGNIYRGKVMNVLSGMQAAFVNIGLDKNAFLYVGDMLVEKEDVPLDESRTLSIRTGDEVMVQVVKDECGTKGARVTTDVRGGCWCSCPRSTMWASPRRSRILPSRIGCLILSPKTSRPIWDLW